MLTCNYFFIYGIGVKSYLFLILGYMMIYLKIIQKLGQYLEDYFGSTIGIVEFDLGYLYFGITI